MARSLRYAYREIAEYRMHRYALLLARGSVLSNQRFDGEKVLPSVVDSINEVYESVPYRAARSAARRSASDENSAVELFKKLRESLSVDDVAREYARINAGDSDGNGDGCGGGSGNTCGRTDLT